MRKAFVRKCILMRPPEREREREKNVYRLEWAGRRSAERQGRRLLIRVEDRIVTADRRKKEQVPIITIPQSNGRAAPKESSTTTS